MTERVTKTQQLIGFMRAGDWNRALALANTFRMLGPHRKTIRTAHEARVHPKFWRQLGKEPDALVQAGIDALNALYPSLPEEKRSEREKADNPG